MTGLLPFPSLLPVFLNDTVLPPVVPRTTQEPVQFTLFGSTFSSSDTVRLLTNPSSQSCANLLAAHAVPASCSPVPSSNGGEFHCVVTPSSGHTLGQYSRLCIQLRGAGPFLEIGNAILAGGSPVPHISFIHVVSLTCWHFPFMSHVCAFLNWFFFYFVVCVCVCVFVTIHIPSGRGLHVAFPALPDQCS